MRLILQDFSKRSKFWFFFQNIDGIFEKKFWRFEKMLEPAKLPKNETGRARNLKTFKVKFLDFLLNLDVSFKKTLQFFKNRQR